MSSYRSGPGQWTDQWLAALDFGFEQRSPVKGYVGILDAGGGHSVRARNVRPQEEAFMDEEDC